MAVKNAELKRAAMKPITMSRTFQAPRDLVWKAWTEKEQLMRWFGPKGATIPKATMDFRVGGMMHCHMKTGDGLELWARWMFHEIIAPERLVFVNCVSDEKGGVSKHPMAKNWPAEILTTITMQVDGNSTIVNLEWIAVNATDEEIAFFEKTYKGMEQGWKGTLDKLDEFLAQSK